MSNPEIMSWQEHKEREREQAQASLIDIAFEHPTGISAWDIRVLAHTRDTKKFNASTERQIEQTESQRLRDAGKPVPWGITKTPPDRALYGLVLSDLLEEGELMRNAEKLIILPPELFNERLAGALTH